ncbi:SDR family NAD(P)-dependent oxidoreductase [Algoriphagus sp. D3-2-R+10]|uniref:SDR family NAD(P)-dependent oxidoreductase n=1 Tax=Algoriphagus aurantiacus TaxID=3103948 RepID=UPI002B3C163D|nr:SDR family NAD(P)-dependent oxidoreductase [Algoriphagus sp. D3-2-R+10]MEB2777383.1 SDR family NAD(P)-dependent oxidoreductase [Algoriphagus sp. D3-2-R+10]
MSITNKTKRVAVVTGAGGTLCSEMSRSLASQGIAVALLGRSVQKLEVVRQEIEAAGGTAIAISTDVTSAAQVEKARLQVFEQLGLCTILINGAGGNQADAVTNYVKYQPDELQEVQEGTRGFFNLNLGSFQSVLETNTMGTVIPCQIFGKDMAKNGGGTIINIASMNSFKPLSRVGAYGMAKAGVANFTQWLATYLAPANIRVNAIAPGFFVNERSKKILFNADGTTSQRGKNILRQTPIYRFGQASELLGCMNWLISEENAGFVTGTVIPIDGGFQADSGI